MLQGATNCAVYIIEEPFLPWLWPLLALLGLACQALAAWLKLKWLVWAGFALLVCGCAPERDLVLGVGDLIASTALFYLLRKSK